MAQAYRIEHSFGMSRTQTHTYRNEAYPTAPYPMQCIAITVTDYEDKASWLPSERNTKLKVEVFAGALRPAIDKNTNIASNDCSCSALLLLQTVD